MKNMNELLDPISGLSTTTSVGECAGRLGDLDLLQLIDTTLEMDSEPLMNAMVEESYRHPNGFDKISFPALRKDSARLRVHVWKNPPEKLVELPGLPDKHNHKWSFFSRILAGQLHNEVYSAKPSRSGDLIHYEQRPGATGGYTFHTRGPTELRLEDAATYRPEDIYNMAALPAHSVYPVTPYVATIVIELPAIRMTSDLFLPVSAKQTDVEVHPVSYSPAMIRDTLVELRRHLAPTSTPPEGHLA